VAGFFPGRNLDERAFCVLPFDFPEVASNRYWGDMAVRQLALDLP
jgi:hypothetical protein